MRGFLSGPGQAGKVPKEGQAGPDSLARLRKKLTDENRQSFGGEGVWPKWVVLVHVGRSVGR